MGSISLYQRFDDPRLSPRLPRHARPDPRLTEFHRVYIDLSAACLADASRIFCLVINGQIYLRARHDDIALVSCPSPRPFGAAIFYWRYLAEYPADHSRHGQSTTELIDALRAAKLPYVIDPYTPALSSSRIMKEEGARLRASSMVNAVSLP